MKQDMRDFPYRVLVHEKQSAQPILDWLDENVRSSLWTMSVRNIELPRSEHSVPIVDLAIYFARREDLDLFKSRWSGQTRERKIKLRFIRAALFALFHPKTDMVVYEKEEITVSPLKNDPVRDAAR